MARSKIPRLRSVGWLLLAGPVMAMCKPFRDDPSSDGGSGSSTGHDATAADGARSSSEGGTAIDGTASEMGTAPADASTSSGGDASEAGDSAGDSPSQLADGPANNGWIVWGPSLADPTSGILPTVLAGSSAGASWVLQIQQQYPPMPTDPLAPLIMYQAGASVGALGLAYEVTHGATEPGLAALSPAGGVVVVYECATSSPNLCNFTGQVAAGNNQTWNWPFEAPYSDGFRPRVASLTFPTPQGPEALIVEVHMVESGVGSLAYRPGFAIADWGGTPGVIGGVGWGAESVVYENGPCKNPAVAVSSSLSNSIAHMLEVHESAASGLFYRLGALIFDADASTNPPITVAWEGSSVPYPGEEQGENPAVAIYGQTVVEFHESVMGSILSKVGQILPGGGVAWGPSQPYADDGTNPAVAIDPATGNGIEVHESRTNKAQLVERSFVVLSDGGPNILDAGSGGD